MALFNDPSAKLTLPARDAALTQLGGLVVDRAVARDFFAEEMRMDRDLLADGARRRLDQVFGAAR